MLDGQHAPVEDNNHTHTPDSKNRIPTQVRGQSRRKIEKVSLVSYNIPQSTLTHIKHHNNLLDQTKLRFSKPKDSILQSPEVEYKSIQGGASRSQRTDEDCELQIVTAKPEKQASNYKTQGKQLTSAEPLERVLFSDAFKKSSVAAFMLPSRKHEPQRQQDPHEEEECIRIYPVESVCVIEAPKTTDYNKKQRQVVTFQDDSLGLDEEESNLLIREAPTPINYNEATLRTQSKNSETQRSKASSKKCKGIIVADVFKKYEEKLESERNRHIHHRPDPSIPQKHPTVPEILTNGRKQTRKGIFPKGSEPSPIHHHKRAGKQDLYAESLENRDLPLLIKSIESVLPNQPKEQVISKVSNQLCSDRNSLSMFRKTLLDRQIACINNKITNFEDNFMVRHPEKAVRHIPSLPMGKVMVFRIYDNWGDPKYVGLNGLQFFDENGEIVSPLKVSFDTASRTDLSKTPQCQIGNKYYRLIQAVENSIIEMSETHVSTITVVFSGFVKIALIRVWNYSARPSARGIKTLEILLDGAIIFAGEIRESRARNREDRWRDCEYILLTNDMLTISKISAKDWLSKVDMTKLRDDRGSACDDDSKTVKDKKLLMHGPSITIKVDETYGDRFSYGLSRIKLYDDQYKEILFKTMVSSRNVLSELTSLNKQISLQHQLVLLISQGRSSPAKISLRNTGNQSAVKNCTISLSSPDQETRIFRTFLDINRNQSQYIYLSNSFRYSKTLINPLFQKYPYGRIITITFLKTWEAVIQRVTINKLELFDVNGVPLLFSANIKYQSSVEMKSLALLNAGLLQHITGTNSIRISKNQSQPDKDLELTLFLEESVQLASLCVWNPVDEFQNQGVRQIKISIDGCVVYSGFVGKGFLANAYSCISLENSIDRQSEGVRAYCRGTVDDEQSMGRVVQLVDQNRIRQKGSAF